MNEPAPCSEECGWCGENMPETSDAAEVFEKNVADGPRNV